MFFCFQVSRNGMTNSVFTLYELSNGDETEGEGVLHSLNIQMSLFCVQTLITVLL